MDNSGPAFMHLWRLKYSGNHFVGGDNSLGTYQTNRSAQEYVVSDSDHVDLMWCQFQAAINPLDRHEWWSDMTLLEALWIGRIHVLTGQPRPIGIQYTLPENQP